MLSTLRLLFALSRTPHGLLDMACPILVVFLWLGRLPSAEIMLIGLVTVFAAYTSGYAVNDLVDRIADRKRYGAGWSEAPGYLDATLPRHPLASGMLRTRHALVWAGAWGLVAAVGSFLLSPASFAIFIASIALEVGYCLLYRLTALRVFVSGVVKTLGPIAGVFAVDRSPLSTRLLLLFLWLFFWEMGGQNIPSDWTDIDEDRALGAKTIPVLLGPTWSGRLAFFSVSVAIALNVAFIVSAPGRGSIPYAVASVAIGAWLLVVPAVGLSASTSRSVIFRLFNWASYYPAALLAAALALKGIASL